MVPCNLGDPIRNYSLAVFSFGKQYAFINYSCWHWSGMEPGQHGIDGL